MASEVAQLRMQIEHELEAMRLGLFGLAAGTTKHEFIAEKMERVGQIEDQLARSVGTEQAKLISCETYIQVMKD